MSNHPLFDFDELSDQSADLAFERLRSASPDSAKFQLFLKVREIKQLARVLQELQLRQKQERRTWIKENQALITELVDDFTDDSLAQLQGVATDTESVKLSMDLVATLRRTLLMVDTLLIESDQVLTRKRVS
jgi:hypothetical protein